MWYNWLGEQNTNTTPFEYVLICYDLIKTRNLNMYSETIGKY